MATLNPSVTSDKIKAIIGTVLIHLLLLFIFMYIRYATPAWTPIPDLGIEVNLGTSEVGDGLDQPLSQESISITSPGNIGAESATQESVRSADDPDAPEIPITETPATRATTAGPSTPKAPQPRYEYRGNSSTTSGNQANLSQTGTGEGITGNAGDQGVPGGTPGVANYTGSPGSGTGGISHNLSGRTLSPNKFTAEFEEGGKVVIRVTVNRSGEIVSKQIKSSPSATLSRIALQKLSEAKFSVSQHAAPQQFGEITIIFKTRS